MSEQAELYKEKAAECERQAVLVSEEHLRKVYLQLARQWLELRGGSRSPQPPLDDQRKCHVITGKAPLETNG